jgi:hypothetical protein
VFSDYSNLTDFTRNKDNGMNQRTTVFSSNEKKQSNEEKRGKYEDATRHQAQHLRGGKRGRDIT